MLRDNYTNKNLKRVVKTRIIKIVIFIVVILAIILLYRAKGFYNSSYSPALKFVGAEYQNDSIPTFRGAVRFELKCKIPDKYYGVAFVAILTDEQYKIKKDESYVGGWGEHQGSWGGTIIAADYVVDSVDANGNSYFSDTKATVDVPSEVIAGSGVKKFWVRTAIATGYDPHRSNLQRLIDFLLRPIFYKFGYIWWDDQHGDGFYASRYFPFLVTYAGQPKERPVSRESH